MTVLQLFEELKNRIPAHLSCSWDNDGLMCCPDGQKEVGKVLLTLDITADAVERAKALGCDAIISHHPLIFKKLGDVTEENHVGGKLISLIKSDIAAMSFHTRLDALEGGVNDVLAALLGIRDAEPFGDEGIGRIGTLDAPVTVDEFAISVKERLGSIGVMVADAGKPVQRVAVLGGEGGSDVSAAIGAGADTFLAGRLGYHNMTDADEMGINLLEAGHFFTEFPVLELLGKMLRDIDKGIDVAVFYSNKIKLI